MLALVSFWLGWIFSHALFCTLTRVQILTHGVFKVNNTPELVHTHLRPRQTHLACPSHLFNPVRFSLTFYWSEPLLPLALVQSLTDLSVFIADQKHKHCFKKRECISFPAWFKAFVLDYTTFLSDPKITLLDLSLPRVWPYYHFLVCSSLFTFSVAYDLHPKDTKCVLK